MGTKRTGHYCRICGRYRANEKFSNKGHRIHVCEDCARLPVEERRGIEQEDEITGFLKRSNISQANMLRLKRIAASPNSEIARLSRLILEIARVHPEKKRRLRLLARERKDLLVNLRRPA